MPKRDQKRNLPTDLRSILAENLDELMTRKQLTNTQVAAYGVSRPNIGRIRRGEIAATLDTVQALAKALDLEAAPWVLLMKGGVASMGKVFTTPYPDAKMGPGWAAPGRKPLLQSGSVKSSTRMAKLKSR